jgi:hypothetical protein
MGWAGTAPQRGAVGGGFGGGAGAIDGGFGAGAVTGGARNVDGGFRAAAGACGANFDGGFATGAWPSAIDPEKMPVSILRLLKTQFRLVMSVGSRFSNLTGRLLPLRKRYR